MIFPKRGGRKCARCGRAGSRRLCPSRGGRACGLDRYFLQIVRVEFHGDRLRFQRDLDLRRARAVHIRDGAHHRIYLGGFGEKRRNGSGRGLRRGRSSCGRGGLRFRFRFPFDSQAGIGRRLCGRGCRRRRPREAVAAWTFARRVRLLCRPWHGRSPTPYALTAILRASSGWPARSRSAASCNW